MPKLLNSAVQLKGTTGTNSYFITLSGAQPLLGPTPTTSTGYTLVSSGPNGLLTFTNTLGLVKFENSIIQTSVPDGDLTIQSTGTGRLNLNGAVYINGQIVTAGVADFNNLTATNLTILGRSDFISATNTTTFLTDVVIKPTIGKVTIYSSATGTIDNVDIGTKTSGIGIFTTSSANQLFATSATILTLVSTGSYLGDVSAKSVSADEITANTATFLDKLSVSGGVTLSPIDEDVNIAPTLNGTVYINPARAGYMDGMVIGVNRPESGYFTNVITDNLTLNQTLTINTANFTSLIVSTMTATTASIVNLSVSGIFTASNVYSTAVYDNGNRVLTNIKTISGPGIASTASIVGTTATVVITNTGVISLIASTGTAVSNTSGNVVIWSTATLQTVTDFGSTTTNAVKISNSTPSTTSTDGALIVTGGVGIGNNLNVAGDVYSDGGSPFYNRLLYTPKVTVSATAPLNSRIGDFWIDSTAGIEYQLIPNGNSTIWVQFIGF